MSMVPQHLGKYELRGRLGRGGMAEVWKAFDSQLERFVAIKILRADIQNDPDFMKRFVREAQVVASLHHPNIVQVHDFQVAPPELDHTGAYMVMDYVEGQTLAEYIHHTSRLGKFPPATDIVYLFTRICGAVDYAHRHGMIHRDIKPANILLDQKSPSRYEMGTPFLTDFGIVKLIGAATDTLSGEWLGTPLYISPEQTLGHPGNERSDIYSLGVILYEICTGVRPFQGGNIASIIMQHVNTTPTLPALINPKVTPALSAVIMQALAKDPADRFPGATSMAIALTQAFNIPITSQIPSIRISQEPASLSLSPPAITPATPQLANEVLSHHTVMGEPTTPLNTTNSHSLRTREIRHLPDNIPSQMPPSSSRRRRRGVFVTLIALALLVIVGSSVGIFYFTTHRNMNPSPAVTSPLAGHAVFINSGPLNNDNSQGIEDELQISLQPIPDPATGKSYYAWLLSDNNQSPMTSLFLGKPSLIQKSMHILYQGDAQHSNLLTRYSRFLITEEDSNSTSTSPSSDRHSWRYYAEIPQTVYTSFNKVTTMLYDLRALLGQNITSYASNPTGDVANWLLRNTQRVLNEATGALDAWNSRNPDALRSHLANTLAYIDGASYLQKELPTALPSVRIDAHLYQVGLLALTQEPIPTPIQSYLRRTHLDLLDIIAIPTIPPDKSKLADQTDKALYSTARDWLQTVHDDAISLFPMTNGQLFAKTAQSTLQDMVSQANYAYNGQTVGKVQQEGIQQIYKDIQNLAAFDVQPYSSH